MNIALAISDKTLATEGTDDDRTLQARLRNRDHVTVMVPWDSKVDWSSFDMVVVRSTWDYHLRLDEFVQWLESLERSGTRVVNSVESIRWNLDKRYLLELAAKGVDVVPTVLVAEGERADLESAKEQFQTRKLIVKPTVGATAHGIEVIDPDLQSSAEHVGPILVQPFVESILSEGEISVVAICGEPTHAIRKTAAQGEFRVQVEWGGSAEPMALTGELERVTMAALATIPSVSYARADFVRIEDRLLLSELELIEPELFLSMSPRALDLMIAAIEGRTSSV